MKIMLFKLAITHLQNETLMVSSMNMILKENYITRIFLNNSFKFFFLLQFTLSMIGVIILSACSLLVTPPIRLPDLFPVLISIYSCAHFLVFLVYFHVKQFMCTVVPVQLTPKRKKQS